VNILLLLALLLLLVTGTYPAPLKVLKVIFIYMTHLENQYQGLILSHHLI